MRIGIPKALLYYRFGTMWETFFNELGCEIISSGDTNQQMMQKGAGLADGECCLPLKIFLGHVSSLAGRCDRVLVPRFERTGRDEEFCVRFWGLPDIVRSTFEQIPLLTYNLRGQGSELNEFLVIGNQIGKSKKQAHKAYKQAKRAQLAFDADLRQRQNVALRRSVPTVLLAGHSYIVRDSYVGGPIERMVREQGAQPVYVDRCDRNLCRKSSKELTKDLYWTMNKEAIGSIQVLKRHIDGVILLSAFPCGTDSLANELALRRIRGIPVTQIVLDEQQGEAGLQTRIESFLDIIKEKRRSNAS